MIAQATQRLNVGVLTVRQWVRTRAVPGGARRSDRGRADGDPRCDELPRLSQEETTG